MVTYWWAADGGVTDLGGWATGLTSVGRLTGLVASFLLLAQVLLMARVPAAGAAFGQDRLARMHRLVGFTSFNLMLAHIVLITWGYAAGELDRTPATLWDLTTNYPGMLLAAAGTVCLVMVVVTSVKAARRGCATSPGTCCTSTPTSASGWPCRTSSGPGRSSSPRRLATVFWWTHLGAGRRPRSWSGGSACRCGAARATAAGHLGRAGRATASCRCT